MLLLPSISTHLVGPLSSTAFTFLFSNISLDPFFFFSFPVSSFPFTP